MSEVLPYLELQKDNLTEEEKKEQVKVPNVEGMTVKEAQNTLEKVGLDFQIENELEELDKEKVIVQEQLPKKEISVYEGTKIILKIQ